MEDYIWKILHTPTGLYYSTRKGVGKNQTNLSKKGNHYTSENSVNKVLADSQNRTAINKAQTEKFNIPIIDAWSFYNKAIPTDLKIQKFKLELVEEED